MGPNVRVSMLISLAFLASLTWLVGQVSRPLIADSSPVIVGRSRRGPAASRFSRSSRGSIRFGSASVLERQSQALAETSPRLVVADAAPRVQHAGMKLPPLSAIAMRWAKRAVGGSMDGPPSLAEPEQIARGRSDQPRSNPVEHGPRMTNRVKPEPIRNDPMKKPPAEPKRYVVRKGDSLWKIARSEWNSTDPALIRLLIRANPQLHKRDRIRAGQTLMIPVVSSASRVAGPPPIVGSSPQTKRLRWYTIRRNDSLARIAKRELKNARRWPEIVKLNRSLDARKPIFPGMRIRLPAT